MKLFKKHGIESIGYWVPTDEPKSSNTLIYALRYESRESAKKSWRGFVSDPDWQAAYKASEADGPILAMRPESVYMNATDYSKLLSSAEASDDAVFELRIYKTNKGKARQPERPFPRPHHTDL